MKKPRCDKCKFWLLGDHQQFGVHRDDRIGNCVRHAPRPSLGQYEYEVLNLLSVLVYNVDPDDNSKAQNNWEEAATGLCLWPQTFSVDWCGEFKAK